jgi:hypothetical protein
MKTKEGICKSRSWNILKVGFGAKKKEASPVDNSRQLGARYSGSLK